MLHEIFTRERLIASKTRAPNQRAMPFGVAVLMCRMDPAQRITFTYTPKQTIPTIARTRVSNKKMKNRSPAEA